MTKYFKDSQEVFFLFQFFLKDNSSSWSQVLSLKKILITVVVENIILKTHT